MTPRTAGKSVEAQAAARVKRRPVTVAIVTYNSAESLPGCLDHLGPALEGLDHELVVVDNNSQDHSVAVVEEHWPSATIVRNSLNVGYAAGINIARRHSVGRDLLIMNPDVRLDPGSVAKLSAVLDDSRVGIAVPRLRDGNGRLDLSLRRTPSILRALGEAVLGGERAGRIPWLGEVVSDPQAYDQPSEAAWGSGCALLVSDECHRDVGAWDENFFLYSEEIDFALRAGDAGYALQLVPSATAVHLRGQAHDNADLWALLVWNRCVLHRKRYGYLAAFVLRWVLLFGESLRAPRSRTHRAAAWTLLRGHPPAVGPPPEEFPPDYVCLSGFDWWYHSHAHADIQLMKQLSHHRRVLFVNSIGLRLPLPGRTRAPFRRIGRKVRSMLKLLRPADPTLPHLSVVTPFSFPGLSVGLLRQLNARLVRFQIRRALRTLGFRRVNAVVCLPSFAEVVDGLDFERLVYYRYDKHSGLFRNTAPRVAQLERQLLARADLVLHSSRRLLEEEKDMAPGTSVFFDHGVGSTFGPASDPVEPPDLARIPRPRAGYIGTLRDYAIDVELLERLAHELPDTQIIVVGGAQCDVSELRAFPNVHLLGPRPHMEVPKYAQGFDVALLPLHDNEFTRYQNPIKLKEYLALGLPVVASNVPATASFREVIRIAQDRDHFVSLVRETLSDGGPADPERRRAVGCATTWEAQAQRFLTLVEKDR